MQNIDFLDEIQQQIVHILHKKEHLNSIPVLNQLRSLLLEKLIHLENITVKSKCSESGDNNLDLFAKNIEYQIFEKGEFLYHYKEFCSNVYIILHGEVGIWEKKKDIEITRQMELQKKIQELEEQKKEAFNQVELDYFDDRISEVEIRLEKYRKKSTEQILKTSKYQNKYYMTPNVCGYKNNYTLKEGSFIGENQAVSQEKFEKSYQVFSEKCVAIKISSFKFTEIFELEVKKINFIEKTLAGNFPLANPQSLLWLAYQATDKFLNYDEKVFQEGDTANSIYIIRQGNIELTKLLTIQNSTFNKQNIRKNVTHEKRLELATLSDGNMFGIEDLRLNYDEKEGASVKKKRNIDQGNRYYKARATFNPISLVYEISKDKINKIILENQDIPLSEDFSRLSKMKYKWMKERFQNLVDFSTKQMNQIFMRRQSIQAQMASKNKKLIHTVINQLIENNIPQQQQQEQQQQQQKKQQTNFNNSQDSISHGNTSMEQSLISPTKKTRNSVLQSHFTQHTQQDTIPDSPLKNHSPLRRSDKRQKTWSLQRLKSLEPDKSSPLLKQKQSNQQQQQPGQSPLRSPKLRRLKSQQTITLETNLTNNLQNDDFIRKDKKALVIDCPEVEDSAIVRLKQTEYMKKKMHVYTQKLPTPKLIKNGSQIGFPSIEEDVSDMNHTPFNMNKRRSIAALGAIGISPTHRKRSSLFQGDSMCQSPRKLTGLTSMRDSQATQATVPQQDNNSNNNSAKNNNINNNNTNSAKTSENYSPKSTRNLNVNTSSFSQFQQDSTSPLIKRKKQAESPNNKLNIPGFYTYLDGQQQQQQQQNQQTTQSLFKLRLQKTDAGPSSNRDSIQLQKTTSLRRNNSDLSELSEDSSQFEKSRIYQETNPNFDENHIYYNENFKFNTNNAIKKPKNRQERMTEVQQFDHIVQTRVQVKEKYFKNYGLNSETQFLMQNQKQLDDVKKHIVAKVEQQRNQKKQAHFQPTNFKANTDKLLEQYMDKEDMQKQKNKLLQSFQNLSSLSPLKPEKKNNISQLNLQNLLQKEEKLPENEQIKDILTNRNSFSYRSASNSRILTPTQSPKKIFKQGTLGSIQQKHLLHQKLIVNNNNRKFQKKELSTLQQNLHNNLNLEIRTANNSPHNTSQNASCITPGIGTVSPYKKQGSKSMFGSFYNNKRNSAMAVTARDSQKSYQCSRKLLYSNIHPRDTHTGYKGRKSETCIQQQQQQNQELNNFEITNQIQV